MRKSSKWSLPFIFPDNILCISHLSHACYMPLPSRMPSLWKSYFLGLFNSVLLTVNNTENAALFVQRKRQYITAVNRECSGYGQKEESEHGSETNEWNKERWGETWNREVETNYRWEWRNRKDSRSIQRAMTEALQPRRRVVTSFSCGRLTIRNVFMAYFWSQIWYPSKDLPIPGIDNAFFSDFFISLFRNFHHYLLLYIYFDKYFQQFAINDCLSNPASWSS